MGNGTEGARQHLSLQLLDRGDRRVWWHDNRYPIVVEAGHNFPFAAQRQQIDGRLITGKKSVQPAGKRSFDLRCTKAERNQTGFQPVLCHDIRAFQNLDDCGLGHGRDLPSDPDWNVPVLCVGTDAIRRQRRQHQQHCHDEG